MPSDTKTPAPLDPTALAERFQTLAIKSQAAVQEFLLNRPDVANIGMGDPAKIGQAFFELTTKLMADPRPIARAQIELWEQSVSLWAQTLRHLLGGEPLPVSAPDKRFKHPEWAENAIFSYIRDSYLLFARAILSAVRDVKGLDEETSRKVEFYTKQFVDALAPSNFAATNPEVLSKTIETGGENLLSGLTNLLDDLQRGKGRLSVTMTDMNAFRLGDNIATTPGKVVFQNEMIQLIQYAPMTEHVRKTPLLIIPPWINKFYVLDLQPKNSFIRWCVEQGHTVFVISWINPDARLRDKSFEHYMLEGPIEAMAEVEKATSERAVNCVGYCLGGTLLASTLAYLAAKGDDRVKSATYFVTLVDFVASGDMSVFIDAEQLAALETRMNEKGYLDAQDMATSFNMLRANDLIWSFVVGNYLLGKEPVPFDLLYWNSDATRMPAAMHSFYLRNMYQENNLAKPGGIALDGTPIDLRKITTPTFILGTKEDHIAPWKSAYRATQLYGGPVEFVLSASGHMAGVISAPGSKYGHWTNSSNPATADEWFKTATERPSSWWPHWNEWVTLFSGGQVAARTPGESLPVIEDAPGSYVRVRSDGRTRCPPRMRRAPNELHCPSDSLEGAMDDDAGDRSRTEKAIEAVKDMASSTTYAANSAATPSEEEKMTVMDVPLVADVAAMPMPLVAPKKGKARAKRAPTKTPPKKAAAAKAAKKTAKKSATAAKNSKRAAKHSPAAAGRKIVGKKKVAKKKKAKTSRR